MKLFSAEILLISDRCALHWDCKMHFVRTSPENPNESAEMNFTIMQKFPDPRSGAQQTYAN